MQITRLLDGLEPERFSGVFMDNLKAVSHDLYADYSTCKAIVEQGMSFIFTCRQAIRG
jgi:hypothetical protein